MNGWEYRIDYKHANLPKNKVIDLLKFRLAPAEALINTLTKLEYKCTSSGSNENIKLESSTDKRKNGFNH